MEGPGDRVGSGGRKWKRVESAADYPSKWCRGASPASPSNRTPGYDDTLAFLMVLKENLDRNTYQEFLEIMKDMHARRLHPMECVKRAKELLKVHPELALGFNEFLPKGWGATDPLTSEKKPDYGDALAFVRKIKSRFSNNEEKYRSFLYILSMYRTARKSTDEAYQEVMTLFGDHDDLLQEFSCFISYGSESVPPRCVSSSRPFRHQDEGRPTNTNDAQDEKIFQKEGTFKLHADCDLSSGLSGSEHSKTRKYLERVGMVSKDWKDYVPGKLGMEHEKALNNFPFVKRPSQRIDINVTEPLQKGHQARLVKDEETFMDMEHERDNTKGKLSENDRIIERKWLGKGDPSLSKDADPYRNNLFRDNENCELGKADLELDLSNCHRHFSSYCLLPKNNWLTPPSYITKRTQGVLNDRLVSGSSGSENCFKIMRRNNYEECLFRCEDDRFEVEMLIKMLSLTAKRVKELLEKVQRDKVEAEIDIHIEDYITSQDFRCIELLYDDYGLDFVNILRENVSATLPILLTHLKKKQEEAIRKQSDFQQVWDEVNAKNYPRSLDCHSFLL